METRREYWEPGRWCHLWGVRKLDSISMLQGASSEVGKENKDTCFRLVKVSRPQSCVPYVAKDIRLISHEKCLQHKRRNESNMFCFAEGSPVWVDTADWLGLGPQVRFPEMLVASLDASGCSFLKRMWEMQLILFKALQNVCM